MSVAARKIQPTAGSAAIAPAPVCSERQPGPPMGRRPRQAAAPWPRMRRHSPTWCSPPDAAWGGAGRVPPVVGTCLFVFFNYSSSLNGGIAPSGVRRAGSPGRAPELLYRVESGLGQPGSAPRPRRAAQRPRGAGPAGRVRPCWGCQKRQERSRSVRSAA